jgi:hypothetical protein
MVVSIPISFRRQGGRKRLVTSECPGLVPAEAVGRQHVGQGRGAGPSQAQYA